MTNSFFDGAERGAAFLDEKMKEKSSLGNGNAPGGDSIGIPTPLPKLPDVPEFPLEILPDALRDWVADAADRAQFRPEFAAVPCMVALGSIVGRKLGIRLKKHDDWTEYGNLWGAVVGQPSALKSPAMREALRPFKALQAVADEEHSEAMAGYRADLERAKIQLGAKKKAAIKTLAKNPEAEVDWACDEPEEPASRTYWTSDVTAERLGELLAENPNGILVERDELSAFLVKLEDETQATARGLFLSGWSGQEAYRFDRIGRGLTNIPKFALSIVGGVQPGPLSRYVRNAYSARGRTVCCNVFSCWSGRTANHFIMWIVLQTRAREKRPVWFFNTPIASIRKQSVSGTLLEAMPPVRAIV